jgi:hypothetical protein
MNKIVAALAISLSCTGAWATPILDSSTGHYYDVIFVPVDQDGNGITWDNARVAALAHFYAGLEGHLATITSASEDGFVGQAVANAGFGEFWAGGYQDPSAGDIINDPQAGWTWVNGGGAFSGNNGGPGYANWNGGEPNDYYYPGSEQFLGLNLGVAGGFNDEGNLGNIAGYVIEYDPNTIRDVPDGGSTVILLGSALTGIGVLRRKLSA